MLHTLDKDCRMNQLKGCDQNKNDEQAGSPNSYNNKNIAYCSQLPQKSRNINKN